MRINLLSLAKDANDKKSWSGTPYMVLKALKDMGHEVNVFYILPQKTPVFHKVLIKLYRLISILTHKKHLYWFSDIFQKELKKQCTKIQMPESDLIFVVGQSFLIPPLIPCKAPLIYLCDATYSAVENYYPEFSNVYMWNAQQANKICKQALINCNGIIMSSQWAKSHAVNDYHIPSEKISVVEFGANIESSMIGEIDKVYYHKKTIKILFSGVHWERKGGEVAVECCDQLVNKGYDVRLVVAGVDVPTKYQRDYIDSVGFLNKNNPEEYEKYVKILESTDILLFPSKAECSAIALCEAAGFSLPVFAYDTGGLSNYVKDGYNGRLLNLENTGADFADAIDYAVSFQLLKEYSDNARNLYKTKLNWKRWRDEVELIIERYHKV